MCFIDFVTNHGVKSASHALIPVQQIMFFGIYSKFWYVLTCRNPPLETEIAPTTLKIPH